MRPRIAYGEGTSPLSIGIGVVWIGIGYNLFVIPQAPFLMENAPPERRTALFALASAPLFWADFLGERIGGLLPDGLQRILPLGPTPYAGPILFTALLDFLALLPLLGIRERPWPAAAAALPPAPSLSISPLSLALPHLLLGIGAGLSRPFLIYFRERYGMPDEALGALFAAALALTGLGALLAPPLARRWGRIPTVALPQGLSVLALIGMALTEQAGLAALAMLLRSMLMNMGAPLYTEFCMATLPPREQGIASSLLNAARERPSDGWPRAFRHRRRNSFRCRRAGGIERPPGICSGWPLAWTPRPWGSRRSWARSGRPIAGPERQGPSVLSSDR